MSSITPNMSLTVPSVGSTIGPTWASEINNSLSVIDSHNHSPGYGVPINPDGIQINSDLPFNQNNALSLRSVRFYVNTSPIGTASDLSCLYAAGTGGDLYFNDGSGNQIRITQSGSVSGASGTITGLPSGTASAAFVSGSGTFVFQQSTSTGANLDVASIAIRYPGSYPTPSGNYIQLQASSSLATGYSYTLPATLPPVSGSLVTSDASGGWSYSNVDGSTIQLSSAVISVKDGGITKPKLAALGQQISSSCGNFSTASATFVDVTNLSVSITTTGRPVMIFMISDGTDGLPSPGQPGTVYTASEAVIKILRGATAVSYNSVATGSPTAYAPCSSFSVIDAPAAGTYTYKVQIRNAAGAGSGVQFSKLVAYEL